MLRVGRNGSLFVSKYLNDSVNVCRVHSDLYIQSCNRIALPGKHYGFDVHLADNGILLAAAFNYMALVLFRVDAKLNVQSLSNASLPAARFPLFCRGTQLVAVAEHYPYRKVKLESFSIREDILQSDRQRLLFDRNII